MAPTVSKVYICRHLGPATEVEKVSPEGPGRLPWDTVVPAGAECRPGWRWGSPGPRAQSCHAEHRDHVTASLEGLCDSRVALSVATVGMSPSPPGRPQPPLHPIFRPPPAACCPRKVSTAGLPWRASSDDCPAPQGGADPWHFLENRALWLPPTVASRGEEGPAQPGEVGWGWRPGLGIRGLSRRGLGKLEGQRSWPEGSQASGQAT